MSIMHLLMDLLVEERYGELDQLLEVLEGGLTQTGETTMVKHVLSGGVLHTLSDGIAAQCSCGWASRGHFSGAAASAAFMEHKEATVEDKDIPASEPFPWHPMTDSVDLKHLDKLGEEAGELVSAVCRCLCQGIEERNPDNDKPNRLWLEDEIADVFANAHLVIERFKLDRERMAVRTQLKIQKLSVWHRMT